MPHPRDWQREQMPRGCPGRGDWAPLELTDALQLKLQLFSHKFEFNACDWLSRSAATRQINKGGEDEPGFEVDQHLSESHTFSQYKIFEDSHGLWNNSFVPFKQVGLKAKSLVACSRLSDSEDDRKSDPLHNMVCIRTLLQVVHSQYKNAVGCIRSV